MKYTDLTPEVGEVYRPTSALVFYEDSNRYNPQSYVEYLHLDSNGNPTSAQPLTLDQAQALAKTLTCQKEQAQAFLVPKGIIPRRVLHLSHKGEGQAVWYSKTQKKQLFFASSLAIESKEVSIPPLLWKATPKSLWIYALAKNQKPHLNTPLCYAPFFNIYENGNVCMGSVQVNERKASCLEDFITQWEDYFFNSYFSHQLGSYPITKIPLITLWQKLTQSNKPFPCELLNPNHLTLQQIL